MFYCLLLNLGNIKFFEVCSQISEKCKKFFVLEFWKNFLNTNKISLNDKKIKSDLYIFRYFIHISYENQTLKFNLFFFLLN